MAETFHSKSMGARTVSAPAAATLPGGQVVQQPDGRAGVVQGLRPIAAGMKAAIRTTGVVTVAKTASINILAGGQVFWDRSANTATFTRAAGDFYLGVAVADSLAAATTVAVDLNAKPSYLIDFDGTPNKQLWTAGVTDGSGTVWRTEVARTIMAFDAVAEVAMAAIYPSEAKDHVAVADGPILEMKVAVFDIGDDAALDINWGLANESHATDADSITESVFFHLDGAGDLSVTCESDDGTTEVAATDSTVDMVDDTYAEFWIDARNPADIQLYINGINVLPASVFKLDAATGPIFPLVHLEKTSNDVVADFRVDWIRMRTSD